MSSRERSYAYKKKYLRGLARAADKVGYALRRSVADKELKPNRILVVRLDQLGDIIQTIPFFVALKKFFPQSEIHFLTTSIGAELFSGLNLVDKFHVWNCPWFDKKRRGAESSLAWRRRLKQIGFDCVFELRGDIRLITLIKSAGIKNIVGYGATGGGFMLDVGPAWEPGMHAIDKNLRLLEAIHAPIADRIPKIAVSNPKPLSARAPLAIHPDAGTSAKKWPVERFVELIERIHKQLNIQCVLVGLDAKLGETIVQKSNCPVDNKMGKTDLHGLIELLSGCRGLVSNDSGPAHLMAALSKPVWVLWSGTAEKSIWAPRGKNVFLFEHQVPCAPCSLSKCNVSGHPCMTWIGVDEVFQSIVSHVQTTKSERQGR